jgi:hypothetical protein
MVVGFLGLILAIVRFMKELAFHDVSVEECGTISGCAPLAVGGFLGSDPHEGFDPHGQAVGYAQPVEVGGAYGAVLPRNSAVGHSELSCLGF